MNLDYWRTQVISMQRICTDILTYFIGDIILKDITNDIIRRQGEQRNRKDKKNKPMYHYSTSYAALLHDGEYSTSHINILLLQYIYII